jgi:transposase
VLTLIDNPAAFAQSAPIEITAEQFRRIEDCLPRQLGNVGMTKLEFINAILHVAEQGYKWRGLPKRLGNWHFIHFALIVEALRYC